MGHRTGRMAAMSGRTFPDDYYMVAGGLITSCGWVDCLLYTMTRRVLISSELTNSGGEQPARPSGYSRSRTLNLTNYGHESNAGGSTDSIINDSMRMGDIKAETKVEITVSDADTGDARSGSTSFTGAQQDMHAVFPHRDV
jgi:hypothetical protein